jgi:formylmethanofuran dehydrogenase subunit E
MEWLFDIKDIPPPPDPPKILPNKICKRCNISKPITKFCNNRPTCNHCSNENKRDIKFRQWD